MSPVTVTCPTCNATNRLPPERLGDQPKCGRCRGALFAGQPLVIDNDNVDALLRNTGIPLLVDCWAPWCGPCRNFAPVFEAAARQLEPRLRFAKLDTEQHPELARLWDIQSIPTLLLFRAGREVARISGALTLTQLKQWLLQQAV
jgi:thioredoxin 2